MIQKIEKDFYEANIYGEPLYNKKIHFPMTASDVQRIIKQANINKEKIHPVSTAKSYGMGTKINNDSNSSYLDLKYLKNIKNYCDKSGIVEIESGVTQKELSEYLKKIDSNYTVNVTGSSEDSSIVANIIDRGIGHFNEREKDIISLRVVTGEGKYN